MGHAVFQRNPVPAEDSVPGISTTLALTRVTSSHTAAVEEMPITSKQMHFVRMPANSFVVRVTLRSLLFKK